MPSFSAKAKKDFKLKLYRLLVFLSTVCVSRKLWPPASMTALDAGVTLSPASQQELRLGVLSDDRLRLTLGYRWLGPWWLISADLMYWPGDTGARMLAALKIRTVRISRDERGSKYELRPFDLTESA